MNVHVTGANGFVASHIVRELQTQSHEVTTSGSDKAFDPSSILETKPNVVIHAGAYVGRERCTAHMTEAVRMNVISTMKLAKACAAIGTSLLYVSSVEVYGNARGVLHETDAIGRPRNAYSLTKQWAEDACRLLMPSELVSIARLGMQYGPGARVGADTLTNFISAAERGEQLRVYRDATRCWTYAGDSARALVLIAEECIRWREHGRHTTEPMIYNVESDDEHALVDVANSVIDLVGNGSIVEVTAPVGYSDIPRLQTGRLRKLGWEPQIRLKDGMRLTYGWMRERQQIAA